jgi:hypothetical protein
LKNYIFILLFCLTQHVLKAQNVNVFSLNKDVLAANKLAIANKDPNKLASYKVLIELANKSLQFKPVSVMEKLNTPPSGDKHDYMSLAPYFWPNPDTKDGLPYIRKDGQTNPEVNDYKDKEYMPALCAEVEKLALAFYFSGEEKYAKHAANILRVWFLDDATKMNPNLNYGQAVKGQNDGRGAGLIDTRHFIKVVEAAGILQNSTYWTPLDNKGLQAWFGSFLEWMQKSKNGTDEMNATNNHGVWYDAQRLSFALYNNNTTLAKKIISNVKKRIESQMDKDGFFPKELARTTSLHYSLFVLEPLVKIAQMSTKVGVDLWSYTAPNGNSIKKGCDALVPYLIGEKSWTGEQIKPFNFDEPLEFFAEIFKKYNCPGCIKKVADISNPKYIPLQIIY